MTERAPNAGRVRSVLLGIAADEKFAVTPALDYAAGLAAGHDALLSLYVFPPIPSSPLPMTASSATAWLQTETERLQDVSSATVRAVCHSLSDAGVEVIAEHGNSPFEPRNSRFVRLARVNDLTVLDAAEGADTAGRTVIEDVLFDSGRPVVVVPRNGGKPSPRRIAIAWDGSARAARAVADALPFLADADAVFAVTVTGEKDLSRMAPGADLALYLAKHDVNDCKLATLMAAERDVATRLRLFAAEEEIDMIVMGAFVHTRFREALLGGVTRSLLDDSPVPLFLAH